MWTLNRVEGKLLQRAEEWRWGKDKRRQATKQNQVNQIVQATLVLSGGTKKIDAETNSTWTAKEL